MRIVNSGNGGGEVCSRLLRPPSPSVFGFLKTNSQRVIVKVVTCHYFESLLMFRFWQFTDLPF